MATLELLQHELKKRKEIFNNNCTSLAEMYVDLCMEKINTNFQNEFVTANQLGFEIEDLNLDLTSCGFKLGACWAIPNFKSVDDYDLITFNKAARDLTNELYNQLTYSFTPFVEELKKLGFEVYVSEESGNLIPFFTL